MLKIVISHRIIDWDGQAFIIIGKSIWQITHVVPKLFVEWVHRYWQIMNLSDNA